MHTSKNAEGIANTVDLTRLHQDQSNLGLSTFVPISPSTLGLLRYSLVSHNMTKPTKWVCAQRRLRSAWADLRLRWAHTHFVGFVMSWLFLCFHSHPAVEGIILWGFWDEKMYKGKNMSLFEGPNLTVRTFCSLFLVWNTFECIRIHFNITVTKYTVTFFERKRCFYPGELGTASYALKTGKRNQVCSRNMHTSMENSNKGIFHGTSK